MSQLQVTGEAKIRDIQGPVVANSGVITALDGAASQYVRGDGTLADFPTSTGGGSSVSYYLNSSVSQGTIGGVAYRELSKEPIIGAGTDITISANGYVASYITDANDPDVLSVPGGNFNCEFYFSVNNNTGNPTTYAELYKYDGTTFTLLGSSVAVPESLNQGTTIAPYYFAIPVATAALALTDRLAIRIYVSVDGRVVTLHTENSHLCQVVTTFSKGMVSLNNLTDQSQFITTGTSGTNFNIVSSGDTHTFNLPVASATNTGKLSNTDWSTFNNKVPYTGATGSVDLGAYSLSADTLNGVGIFSVGSGTQSGFIGIKQGTTFLGNISGYNSINANATKFILTSDVNSTNYKSASFQLGSLTNNTERTYTLPDLSGTLALLEGTQTFSGAKTFSFAPRNDGGILLKDNVTTGSSGYVSVGSNGSGITIGVHNSGTNYFHELLMPNSTSYNYTFPASSGTIALTSNIPSVSGTSTYIPVFTGTNSLGNSQIWNNGGIIGMGTNYSNPAFYVVASSGDTLTQGKLAINTTSFSGTSVLQVNGAATLTGNLTGTTAAFSSFVNAFSFTAIGGTSNAGQISLKHTGAISVGDGYVTIAADSSNTLGIYFFNSFSAKFSISALTNNRTYTLPDGTGTLALTSNLSAYLPLTGGTLTGALSGTSATFSGDLLVGLTSSSFQVANRNVVVVNGTSSALYGLVIGGVNKGYIYSDATSVRLMSLDASGFMSFGTNNTERMHINSSGNVGIGTSSPSSLLQLAGGGTGTRGALRFSDAGLSNYWEIGRDNGSTGNFTFSSQASQLMTITTGGNVGIGTSSPSARLTVATSNGETIRMVGQDTIGDNYMTFYNTSGTRIGYIGYGYSNSNIMEMNQEANDPILFSTNNTERMRITSGGNVGIGTTTPATFKLSVAGDGNVVAISSSNNSLSLALGYQGTMHGYLGGISSRLEGYSNNGGYVYLSSSSTWIPASDIKRKRNFETYSLGLDAILGLKPKRYNMDFQDDGDEKQVGLVAQEVKEHIPQAFEQSEDFIGINYNVIIVTLVNAIQELKAEIDELKNK